MAKVNLKPGASYTATVSSSQYDVGRELTFEVYDGNTAYTFASGTTVKFEGTKPSGLGFSVDGVISGNVVTVTTSATMTEEGGNIPAELRFKYNGSDIGSANVTFSVEASPHPEGTTDGDTETAKDLMTRAEQAVTEAETAAETASTEAARAEAAAESVHEAGIDASTAEQGQVVTADGEGGWTWEDSTGGGTSDDIENTSTVSGATVTDALRALSDEIANKQNSLTFDTTPTSGSTNPVTSGGIDTALSNLQTSLAGMMTYYQYARLVTSISSSSDNIHYPSAKCVYDAVSAKEDETTIVTKTASDTSQTLAENTFYVWPEMTSLTITCPSTGGPYAFRFTSGSTATTLTMSGITMTDDFTVEASKVYEINVYQGYGLAASWAVSS